MVQLPSVKDNLRSYIDAGFPILYICTYEEAKADSYILSVAGRKKTLEWNGADGLVDFKTKASKNPQNDHSLEAVLSYLKMDRELDRTLLVVKDADGLLASEGMAEQPGVQKVTALLKEIARKIRKAEIDATIIIVSPVLHIPKPLEKIVTIMELDLPDEEEIGTVIRQFMKENDISDLPGKFLDELVTALKGLSESEIKDLLSLALAQEGELTGKTLKLIFDQKQQMILKAGVLEMIPLKESIADIGGLENLKEWIQNKAKVFKNMKEAAAFGVTMPKGVLIAGVPGCGKSLSAKAAGKLFDVPFSGWTWDA